MVQFSRVTLFVAATCCTTVSSFALAAATLTDNATAPTPMVNVTVQAKENSTAIQQVNDNQCQITFTYWEHDIGATFDINFVHTNGVDRTTEWFHDDKMPIETNNIETIHGGLLQLVEVWPRYQMVCISKIKLECGSWATLYFKPLTVVITADAIQESWIRQTGQRKTVNWDHGPCLYFRNDAWDKGAFRALNIRAKVFECGDGSNYMCVAGHLETFGN